MVLFDGADQWNEMMWLITDILPKAQPEANFYWLHISYFLQKCKPCQMDLPLLKNDITTSEATFKTTDT